MKKVVLAYSGGLDTSYCVKHLREDRGYEVHSVLVDTGGFSDKESAEIEARAYALGVSSHTTLDETRPYYDQCLRYLLFGNVLRNGTYPLSVSAERSFQAMAVAQHARRIGADAIAHGSTGAGNDQVRFDFVFEVIVPEMEVITPIRDQQLSREAEIAYLRERGVDFDFEKAAYSINQGLWGTSVGGQETLTSDQALPEHAWPSQARAAEPKLLSLQFQRGEPVGISGESFDHPVELVRALQEMAAPYAIGRDTHVGDTIIGIKGRVGFEAAAPILLLDGHKLLEKHTLTKWQQYWKAQLGEWYGMLLHEGQFLDPVMRNIETFLTDTQQTVTGEVEIRLDAYRYTLVGIRSPHDLMSAKFGSYGEMNRAWSGDDVRGFTKILANATKIHRQVNGTE